MDVIKGKESNPIRTLIYGVQGIGKSTFGAAAPAPIFIQTEDGLSHIGPDRFPVSKTFEEVMLHLKELYKEEHDYKTLVVDSLDWLERMVWAAVCSQGGKDSIEGFGYGKGYVMALDTWKRFVDGLEWVRTARSMNIILVAHAAIERFENPETDAYDRYVPRLHKKAAGLLMEYADNVLFANYKTIVKTSESGANKGIGTGQRILRTTERPAAMAKNRFNLPEELPLSWQAYADACAGEKSSQKAAKVAKNESKNTEQEELPNG